MVLIIKCTPIILAVSVDTQPTWMTSEGTFISLLTMHFNMHIFSYLTRTLENVRKMVEVSYVERNQVSVHSGQKGTTFNLFPH